MKQMSLLYNGKKNCMLSNKGFLQKSDVIKCVDLFGEKFHESKKLISALTNTQGPQAKL